MIIQIARRRGGQATAMQVSADTDLSLDEVERILTNLAKKGYIGQDISPDGIITYVFPELLPEQGESGE